MSGSTTNDYFGVFGVVGFYNFEKVIIRHHLTRVRICMQKRYVYSWIRVARLIFRNRPYIDIYIAFIRHFKSGFVWHNVLNHGSLLYIMDSKVKDRVMGSDCSRAFLNVLLSEKIRSESR